MRHRNSWRNPPGVRGRLRKRGLFVGTAGDTGRAQFLNPDTLSTHIQVLGSTGTGKTRLLTWLFSELARVPRAAVIAINPKGSWGEELRDWVIANGLAKRLIWFNPGSDDDYSIGWNPLQPNGLPVAIHAKATREAIRASWGQSDLDETPQLARFLYLALAVARELELTLVDAVTVLYAGSSLRRDVLSRLRDPFVRASLERLDSYPMAMQEQLVASTVARLEAFVMDPTIRAILARRTDSLRVGDAIDQGRILVANIPIYAPLRADDVKLLCRLLVNDILSYAFSRPKEGRIPVYLLIDEWHLAATDDLAVALEAGRELKLHGILSCQHQEQARTEGSERLYHAVMNCCRTKIVFGGLSVEQLDSIARELTIDQFDPKSVKDELYSLEIEPIEAIRVVRSQSRSQGTSRGRSESESSGVTRGGFRAYGTTQGSSETESETESTAQVTGYQAVMGTGQVVMPDGQIITTTSHEGEGASSSTVVGTATARSTARSKSESVQHGRSVAQTKLTQQGTSKTESIGSGSVFSWVPWYEYIKRQRVSSRTFWTEAEFLTEQLKKIKGLPQAHFLLKTPSNAAVVVRAPNVPTPAVGKIKRQEALARIYAQPFYARRDEIAKEEQKLLPEATPTEPRVIPTRGEPVLRAKLRKPVRGKKR